MTKYEILYELCGRLPTQYVGQARARLSPGVEGMTLLEADKWLDLRLREHGICVHPDHTVGRDCRDFAVGCSSRCTCCPGDPPVGYARG
jgi:hypothetical protein